MRIIIIVIIKRRPGRALPSLDLWTSTSDRSNPPTHTQIDPYRLRQLFFQSLKGAILKNLKSKELNQI